MHIPVLQGEVIKYLEPKANENFIDCTAGSGGHAKAILDKTAPAGKILAIDIDEEQVKNLKCQFKGYKNRVMVENDNYVNLKEIVARNKFKKVSGILFDLGFSSFHIDDSKRGFTFSKKEPLDMRYDLRNQNTAEKIVNYWSQVEIEKMLRQYGQEAFSQQIAKEIVNARRVLKITNTLQLVEIIKRAVPAGYRQEKIHFATKTFQALRMAVNCEPDNLKRVLPQAMEVLDGGGRLAVISFHSLEDGTVKNFFKTEADLKKAEIINKKPIQPDLQEIAANPRSRSAKLRVIRKLI